MCESHALRWCCPTDEPNYPLSPPGGCARSRVTRVPTFYPGVPNILIFHMNLDGEKLGTQCQYSCVVPGAFYKLFV